jgi:hypothetical protein
LIATWYQESLSFTLPIGGQREVEGRAGADLSFRPDPAAMPGNDALHDGQADTGAFEFILPMKPLEDIE